MLRISIIAPLYGRVMRKADKGVESCIRSLQLPFVHRVLKFSGYFTLKIIALDFNSLLATCGFYFQKSSIGYNQYVLKGTFGKCQDSLAQIIALDAWNKRGGVCRNTCSYPKMQALGATYQDRSQSYNSKGIISLDKWAFFQSMLKTDLQLICSWSCFLFFHSKR